MLKLNKRLKFNKVVENIIKAFVIFLFALAIFDKSNINYIKDIIVKLDAEQVCSNVAKISFAIKTVSFDLPVLFSFFVFVFNIICVTSFIILLILFIQKLFSNYFVDLKSSNVHCDRNQTYDMVSSIYLLNETFRC